MKATSTAFVLVLAAFGAALAAPDQAPKQFKFSTTIEKERPELDEETRKLIAAYQNDPSEENRAALRKQVERNYDKVIERKKAKLQELKRTAKHASKILEMQEIVDEVVREKEHRIEQTMRRFTDPRLRPGCRQPEGGYVPVLGALQNVSIAHVPVTNEEYARFVKASGRPPPKYWTNGVMPAGRERHPVVHVSYDDAVAYCRWLSDADPRARYRLPTEEEWELAAGHMPKDADFNCGVAEGTTPVDAYAQTLSACGAIDMWGNCWEWTSTPLAKAGEKGGETRVMVVKGGSWRSSRMSCRTEYRDEGRDASLGYDDVGFRVIRETVEPAPARPKGR